MSFYSLSALRWYLFPKSVPNSQMNFSEKPQLECQGPGNNIKIIKRGKKISESVGCCFQSFLLGILTCLGLFFVSLLLFSLAISFCHFSFLSLYCSPKHKLYVCDAEQHRFWKFGVFFFFFPKECSLDKTQPWPQLEASWISVPCFHAWPLSWNPGEFTGVGWREKRRRRKKGVNLYTQSGASEEFTAVFSGDR